MRPQHHLAVNSKITRIIAFNAVFKCSHRNSFFKRWPSFNERMFDPFPVWILQVRSLQVNPSATCVSSTPTTTCSAWPSPPRPPPPDSTVKTPTARTAGARWALRWASAWAASAAAPAWAAPPRAASGWGRRRRRRASRRRPLISGTSSPGKGRARRRWYDEGREEEEHEGKECVWGFFCFFLLSEIKNPQKNWSKNVTFKETTAGWKISSWVSFLDYKHVSMIDEERWWILHFLREL